MVIAETIPFCQCLSKPIVITFLSYKYIKTGPKLFWAKHLRVYNDYCLCHPNYINTAVETILVKGSADCVFTASAVLM